MDLLARIFRLVEKNAGASGENGRLTKVYFDIICRCQPDFFVFENVKGLIKTEKHKSFYHEMKVSCEDEQLILDKGASEIELNNGKKIRFEKRSGNKARLSVV